MEDSRSRDFLNSLYAEKESHKQHRHEMVKNKLMFTIGLFSVGNIQIPVAMPGMGFSSLLFFVPIVSIAYDVYIFSEDFKIKRIGEFILEKCRSKCLDEAAWEHWLTDDKHRENIAPLASLILSALAIAGCGLLLHATTDKYVFYSWLSGCLLLLSVVFGYSYKRRRDLLGEKHLQSLRVRLLQRLRMNVLGKTGDG